MSDHDHETVSTFLPRSISMSSAGVVSPQVSIISRDASELDVTEVPNGSNCCDANCSAYQRVNPAGVMLRPNCHHHYNNHHTPYSNHPNHHYTHYHQQQKHLQHYDNVNKLDNNDNDGDCDDINWQNCQSEKEFKQGISNFNNHDVSNKQTVVNSSFLEAPTPRNSMIVLTNCASANTAQIQQQAETNNRMLEVITKLAAYSQTITESTEIKEHCQRKVVKEPVENQYSK